MRFCEIELSQARILWGELGAAMMFPHAPGSVLALRGSELAALSIAHIALGEAVYCASTGSEFELVESKLGPAIVIGSPDHVKAACRLDRYHPGRYLLSACQRSKELLEGARGVPWPSDLQRGVGNQIARSESASLAQAGLVEGDLSLGILPIAGWIAVGVVGVAAVAAGTYLADEYLEESAAAEVEIEKAKAEANAHAKIEIAHAKIEAGQPVRLDEVDAADADAYQKAQLVKDLAPWVIGGVIASALGVMALRKAKLL